MQTKRICQNRTLAKVRGYWYLSLLGVLLHLYHDHEL